MNQAVSSYCQKRLALRPPVDEGQIQASRCLNWAQWLKDKALKMMNYIYVL